MATTGNQRERLMMAGMFRIDELMAYRGLTRVGVILARPGELGCWGRNNGVFVINTVDDEVWLGKDRSPTDDSDQRLLAEELCTGSGAFVPCSNGEIVHMDDMLARMADPDCLP